MTETKLHHWKSLTNPDYIGAHDLQPNQEAVITIESVERKPVKDPQGKEKMCIVAKIKGNKPLILNKTNCKMITKLFGTPYIEDWAGKQIVIFAQQVDAFGEKVDAIRVKNKKV